MRRWKKVLVTTFFLAHIILMADTVRPLVIFDFNGVLGNVSSFALIKRIGFFKISTYASLTLSSSRSIKKLLYTILESLESERGNYCDMRDYHGDLVPHIMVDWQCGLISSQELLEKVTYVINSTHKGLRKHILEKMAFCLYTPEMMGELVELYPDIFNFAQELKDQGYRLCILSNWDEETFNVLLRWYKKELGIFDHIFVSGFLGMAKPDALIFRYVMERHEGPYILIDDQKENCDSARQEGMYALHCPFLVKKGIFSKKLNTKYLRQQFSLIESAIENDHSLLAPDRLYRGDGDLADGIYSGESGQK